MNQKHAAALEYAAKGFRVFPVAGKKPLIDQWPSKATTRKEMLSEWWGTYPDADVAIATGGGLFVIDVDDKHQMDSLLAISPDADWTHVPRVATSRGYHLYFAGDGKNTAGKIAPKIDTRGEGGFVVAPPSIHDSGHVYTWDVPLNGRLPSLPAEIRQKLTEGAKTEGRRHDDPSQGIPEGQRNFALTSFAGALRRAGATPREIYAALLERNRARCNPPLDTQELEKIARSVGRYQPAQTPGLVVRKLSSIERKPTDWLWKDRIPKGSITLFEGDPGTKKSWSSLAIASAISAGFALPGDEHQEPMRVLIFSAEDSAETVIRPRVEDMGGNMELIEVVEGVRGKDGKVRPFQLSDMPALRESVQECQPELVILDPIIAFMAGKNEWRASDVRSLLAPLADLAALAALSVVAIRHLSKGSTKSIYRGQGSIDFLAAARSCFLFGEHPDDPDRSVMIHQKNSLKGKTPSLVFSVKDGVFAWEGESKMTAEQLLTTPTTDEGKSQIEQAGEFLREILADGSVLSKEIFRQGKEAGLSERTLFRAKAELGIVKARKTMDGWAWELKN